MVGGELVRTTFYFDPDDDTEVISLFGGYEPSIGAPSLPFHGDPSQRILVFDFDDQRRVLVIKAETALKLVRERNGEDLRWEEWKDHVTWVYGHVQGIWVSGSRLYCAYSCDDGYYDPFLEVYDFSAKAPGRGEEAGKDGSETLMRATLRQDLPTELNEIENGYGWHDSIVFVVVNIAHFSNPTRN